MKCMILRTIGATLIQADFAPSPAGGTFAGWAEFEAIANPTLSAGVERNSVAEMQAEPEVIAGPSIDGRARKAEGARRAESQSDASNRIDSDADLDHAEAAPVSLAAGFEGEVVRWRLIRKIVQFTKEANEEARGRACAKHVPVRGSREQRTMQGRCPG